MIISTITKWVLYWFLVVGIFIFILKPIGISHKDNSLIAGLYYFVATLFGAYIYHIKNEYKDLPKLKTHIALLILIYFTLIFSPFLLANFFPLSNELETILLTRQFYFPLFKFNISIVKGVDIIFQQVMIHALIFRLKFFETNHKKIMLYFTAAFFVLHLPLIINFGLFAFFFIIPALLAGVIFSYVLLKFKFGIVYSHLVHVGFYLGSAVLLRVMT